METMRRNLRPLDGIVVIDLSQAAAGPICGTYLATMGAEVIKVERPTVGDMARRTPPYASADGVTARRETPDAISTTVLKRNRGKQSIAIDLTRPEGVQLLRDLVRQADVVLENYRPGVAAKLGVDYKSLRAVKPDLIYCSITGFGTTGPYSHWSAFDTIVQGMSGVMATTGNADGPPTKAGILVGDTYAPVFALSGILGALRVRDRTGQGEFIEISMFDCLVSLMWDEPVEFYVSSGTTPRAGKRLLRMAPWNSYAAKDGHVVICAGQQDHWAKVARLIGRPELLEDPRFAVMEGRLANVAALDGIIEAWTSTRMRHEIVERCQSTGIPCGPVNELPDLISDPHLKARGVLSPLQHPGHGNVPGACVAAFPVRFASAPLPEPSPAPQLGEHTERILRHRLGLSREAMDQLVDRGIVGK